VKLRTEVCMVDSNIVELHKSGSGTTLFHSGIDKMNRWGGGEC
jgi:hypothetical protein